MEIQCLAIARIHSCLSLSGLTPHESRCAHKNVYRSSSSSETGYCEYFMSNCLLFLNNEYPVGSIARSPRLMLPRTALNSLRDTMTARSTSYLPHHPLPHRTLLENAISVASPLLDTSPHRGCSSQPAPTLLSIFFPQTLLRQLHTQKILSASHRFAPSKPTLAQSPAPASSLAAVQSSPALKMPRSGSGMFPQARRSARSQAAA